ncbi:MAG: hypothetical protein ACI4D1_03735 [Lachnospira sp.]
MSDSITGLSNTSYADTYDAKASALTDKLTNKDYSQATDDELMSVCKDFESYFLEQVLKSMEKMAKIDSEDEDSNLFTSMAGIGGTEDTSLNTLGSYFGDEMMSSYAKLITESNNGQGLGIAQQLYEQMKRNYSVDSILEAE